MIKLRPRVLILATLVGVSAVAFAIAAAPSKATYGGKNGLIAFRRYFNSDHSKSAIFTIKPDGSGETQVTRPPAGFVDDQPDWSPDGSLIAFTRCPNDGACAVYVIHADGNGLTRLSPVCAGIPPKCEDDANVTFLPDGKHVAFTRASGKDKHFADGSDQIQHSDVVVSDLQGRDRRVVLRSGEYLADYNFAYFSPDGKQFVYEHSNSPLSKPAHTAALFVANSDGSGNHRITPWSMDAGDNPDWSPDGKWILFRTHVGSDKNCSIDIIHPDGTGLKQLANFGQAANMRSATFSPDGKWIVFATNRGKGNSNPAVYVMQTDGTHLQPVTHSKLWDSAVDWGTH